MALRLRRNVLIFHVGALGDFVLTWPLALAAGRLFPQSRILYVTHAEKGKLAERALSVESIGIESGWHPLFADAAALPESSRKWLAGAHTIISFISTPDDMWTQNVRQLSPEATLLTLRPTPPADFPHHASEFVLQQLEPFPAIGGAVSHMLRSVAARGVGPHRSAGDTVLIHPGSGSRDKCWPLENFIEITHRLRSAGQPVRILLGEVERERLDPAAIARFAPSPIVYPETYLQLFDEFRNARLLLANDCGPAHLAGIVGVPVLSLFGPTNPAVWRPLGPHVQVVHRQPLSTLSVDEVQGMIRDS